MSGVYTSRLIAALMLMLSISGANAQPAGNEIGIWELDGTKIQTTVCGGGLCAKILSVPNASAVDENNPKAELRGRPIAGLEFVTGAKQSGAAWLGKMYSKESGWTLDGELTALSKDVLNLKACCESGHWFCKSTMLVLPGASGGCVAASWKRVQ